MDSHHIFKIKSYLVRIHVMVLVVSGGSEFRVADFFVEPVRGGWVSDSLNIFYKLNKNEIA